MNGFNLSTISELYVGSTSYSAIYKGSTLIWQAGIDYSQEYFTIESLDDNNTISWFLSNGNYGTNKTIEWSTDKTNWTSVTSHYTSPGRTITTLNTGDKIYLKGTNTQLANSTAHCKFNSTGNYNVYGNIMSLLYGDNFIDKTSLTATYTFYGLFTGASLVDASNLILPATTLTERCYSNMFFSCRSLTAAPKLPATTLANNCYYNMFYDCTSLTAAPELPATTLANNCYYNMFQNCTSLTTAPNLPATTLTDYCYYQMFKGCTSLTTPPAMSATTVAIQCCASMFRDDAELTTAPDLLATTLANRCYYYMFRNCTSLQYIKCLATDISASGCTLSMMSNVAATGTFVKDANMTSWTTGQNGIPSGWTVVDAS